MKAIRWSDDDRYFGPFTYAYEPRYRKIAIMLSSGDDDDYPGCRLRLALGAHTMIAALPAIIKPYRQWVDTSRPAWPKGEGGYWDIGDREYGFTYSDGYLSIALGRATNNSNTEQRWGCFLPWTQWRHVRHSFYGFSGEHIVTLPDTGKGREAGGARWDREREIADATPAVEFEFCDFDGERIIATTKIEEREWRFGTGRFKWLSLFRRPLIRRSLDLRFSGETGRRKGSWKGGTVGHSIDMLPGELHEAAFRRYCAEHDMAFVGPASGIAARSDQTPQAAEPVGPEPAGEAETPNPDRSGGSKNA